MTEAQTAMWQANQDARDAIKEAVKASATKEQKASMKEVQEKRRESSQTLNKEQKEKVKEAMEKATEKRKNNPNK
jgi:hypothetical protein